MNDAMRAALTEFVKSRHALHVTFATAAVAANPTQGPTSFSAGDLGQMVDGFVAVILEDLHGRGGDTRTFYLETVIPGLVSAGNRFHAVVHTVTGWTVRVMDDFSRNYTGPDAAAHVEWLATFFAGYVADIARVGAACENGV